MVCTLEKVLEELDKKILKTQNNIKELQSELTGCMTHIWQDSTKYTKADFYECYVK